MSSVMDVDPPITGVADGVVVPLANIPAVFGPRQFSLFAINIQVEAVELPEKFDVNLGVLVVDVVNLIFGIVDIGLTVVVVPEPYMS